MFISLSHSRGQTSTLFKSMQFRAFGPEIRTLLHLRLAIYLNLGPRHTAQVSQLQPNHDWNHDTLNAAPVHMVSLGNCWSRAVAPWANPWSNEVLSNWPGVSAGAAWDWAQPQLRLSHSAQTRCVFWRFPGIIWRAARAWSPKDFSHEHAWSSVRRPARTWGRWKNKKLWLELAKSILLDHFAVVQATCPNLVETKFGVSARNPGASARSIWRHDGSSGAVDTTCEDEGWLQTTASIECQVIPQTLYGVTRLIQAMQASKPHAPK